MFTESFLEDEYYILGKDPPTTFGEALKRQMDHQRVSVEELAYMSGLTERTITSMRSRDGYKPKPENVAILCCALSLPPACGYRLMRLAGHWMLDYGEDLKTEYIIDHAEMLSVSECRRILGVEETLDNN